jgi:hypothetical protein
MARQRSDVREFLPRWFVASGVALLSVLVTAVTMAQEPAQPPAAPPAATPGAQMVLATGPGADVFQRVCVLCHPPDRIVSVRRTKTEWEEVLDKMIARGAQVNDDNYGTIENYLLRSYGKVNVNRAVKDDLVLVGGLTPDEAEASQVPRRNGPFADFAALGKLPGLDLKKLEERRTRSPSDAVRPAPASRLPPRPGPATTMTAARRYSRQLERVSLAASL